MSMAAVLTFDQYAAQTAELKAEFETIKARIVARDEAIEQAMEISIELMLAGFVHLSQQNMAGAFCCTYYINVISAMIETVIPESIHDRDELNACTKRMTALNISWATRFAR